VASTTPYERSDLSREVRVSYRIDASQVHFAIENAASGALEIAPFRSSTTWLSCPVGEKIQLRIDPSQSQKLQLVHTSGNILNGHRFGSPDPKAKALAATVMAQPAPSIAQAVEIYMNAFGVDTGFTLKAPGLQRVSPWMNAGILGGTERVLHVRPDEESPRMLQDIHYSVNDANELEFEIPIREVDSDKYWLSLRSDSATNSGIKIGYEGGDPLTRVFLRRDQKERVGLWREYLSSSGLREYFIGTLGKAQNSFARPGSLTTRLVGTDLDDPHTSNIVAVEFRCFGLNTGFLLKAPKLLARPKWMT